MSDNPYADALAKYARAGEVRRYMSDRETWLRTLRENPSVAPVFADWLEENDLHADPETLHHLRTHGGEIRLGDAGGKVVARPTVTLGGVGVERLYDAPTGADIGDDPRAYDILHEHRNGGHTFRAVRGPSGDIDVSGPAPTDLHRNALTHPSELEEWVREHYPD